MKWHVLRPLIVAIGLVAVVLVARGFMVPPDFGVHGQNFTYGFYRLSNVQEWQDFPAKYQGRDACRFCHRENARSIRRSGHRVVQCENCHGPAAGHPDDHPKLAIDTRREHCLRCHADLGYPDSARAVVPVIDPDQHKRRFECVECHNPHDPGEDL